ncbi:nascent polypeptide-associated complex protein [Candidatus Woesearchaeota archaeon]|nr:nascent polypeptide-associated complex protein [Candidatus Woesearchaeota archaeon]
MIPGLNPKQMRQAMKQMGIKQDDLPATEVIIKLKDSEIIITDPSVQRIVMQGQESFQVSGNIQEKEIDNTPDISEEDIEMVMSQANCTKEEAKAAIEICEGDLAQAIIELNDAKE